MIDRAKKMALVGKIKDLEKSGKSEILLTPEFYFNGYDDERCSICANNCEPISTSRFAARLRELIDRPDVLAVYVRLYEYADATEDPTCWVGSDSIYLVTSAGLGTVRQWFADMAVSDVWEEGDHSLYANLLVIPDDYHLIAVWWD